MTEKRARTPLSKVRIPCFEREYEPVKPVKTRVRFKTVDDVIFEVCDTCILPSTYMNRLIYEGRANKQQPRDMPHSLPNVAADIFEKVLRYCYFHTSRYCDGLLPDEVKDWDDQFMNLDPRELCELASAAYYLDVKELIELTCRAIAAIISGKTSEQIRTVFHIENDLAGTIDRVLPPSMRRRGREHSLKESYRIRDTEGNSSQERNESAVNEESPGAQKSIDELLAWINSSSPKSKKKKKKRGKNPSKKDDDFRANGDEVGDSEAICASSTAQKISINSLKEEREQLPDDEDFSNAMSKAQRNIRLAGKGSITNGFEQVTSFPAHREELSSGTNLDDDGGSANSEVAFVSEKLVNRAAIEERKAIDRADTMKLSKNSETPGETTSKSALLGVHVNEGCPSTTSDAESVQFIELNASTNSPSTTQDSRDAESHAHSDDPSTSDASDRSHQRKPAIHESMGDENESTSERDIAAPRMKTEGSEGNLNALKSTTEDTKREDATMQDAPSIPASHPSRGDKRNTGEPFIACPENMDREVEAFQMRLSITEPLSNQQHEPHAPKGSEATTRTENKRARPARNAAKPFGVNSRMTTSRETPRPRDRLRRSEEGTAAQASDDWTKKTALIDGHSTLVNHSAVPQKVLAELLRINSEKEEFRKIASVIDEETARLGAKREKVRDSLAVLTMRETQLREKYNVSDLLS